MPSIRRGSPAFATLMEESEAAISQEEWDTANAAFHEFQIDLTGNKMLSHVYRELSVNLMMQVIRGGKLEGGEYLAREHRGDRGGVRGPRPPGRPARRSGRTSSRVSRIALDAIERAGGVL